MNELAELEALLLACAQGDRAAFRRLYEQTSGRLMALCRRMMHTEEQAEDVLQEAYVQIWRDAASFDPARASAATWLAVLVRHRALDALRRRREEALGDEELAAVADETPGPLDLTLAAVDGRRLHLCLDGLGERQRESILLAFLRGLSHPQVSAAMAAPLGSVKSWIRRGLEQLKRCLHA
ncbi:RNA polymerase sigma-70 factor (ECF subfamily) [Plasticicumulans lactativorans]|uniref:RNA polymerase sigma-70 factor (ECF subfamily) n=1 Tax=Plasticicumulans lactativorans TaxID=1133106 RepID=A0A4R2KZY4_9GAMM|nr:sigma-70 family RNA polymerase sigma factor [Plasticicumulans lactativorans]TCO80291.1 RNA polymerase sigma-70 factor (ECF subfamily) [Plasticicumulans lactativorans]